MGKGTRNTDLLKNIIHKIYEKALKFQICSSQVELSIVTDVEKWS